jgi:hypothetical protein
MDRAVRVIAGLLILGLLFFVDSSARAGSLLGLPLLVTGSIGWCPAYLPLGFSTCKRP